jgi:hypothetical protein
MGVYDGIFLPVPRNPQSFERDTGASTLS